MIQYDHGHWMGLEPLLIFEGFTNVVWLCVYTVCICVFLCMFWLWHANPDQPGRRNISGQSKFMFTYVLLVFV